VDIGQAFLQNTFTQDPHIWICAHHSDAGAVIFNFTSYDLNKDHSCVITPAEYSELKHDSLIAYRWGRLIEPEKIFDYEHLYIRKYLNPIPSPVLEKIVRGARLSEFTAEKIRVLF
jgi:hypothetical protein